MKIRSRRHRPLEVKVRSHGVQVELLDPRGRRLAVIVHAVSGSAGDVTVYDVPVCYVDAIATVRIATL